MTDVAFELIDGQEASYYRKEKESDTISGHVTKVPYVIDEDANASLSSIAGVHVGGGGVVSTTGSSQTITVPASAKGIVLMPEGGKVYMAVDDGDASTTSHIYAADESSLPWPVTSANVVKVWVVAGVLHYEFLG